ncbi:uncharacterized protein VNE69_08102 [Vairimorpha necatrix]|uniref:Uncharacterized protein n=1 Tax=Vairimorpha necatrix TaxID=6039 RepID=A0AAX4JEC2_9MICR
MLFAFLYLKKTVSIRKLAYIPTDIGIGITILEVTQEHKEEEISVVKSGDQMYVLLVNFPLDWKSPKPKDKFTKQLSEHFIRFQKVVFENILRLKDKIFSATRNMWSSISSLFSKFRSKISLLFTNTLSWFYKHIKMRSKTFEWVYKVSKHGFEKVLKVHKEIRE